MNYRCVDCGFQGRLYAIYGNFLRESGIRCLFCSLKKSNETYYEEQYSCTDGKILHFRRAELYFPLDPASPLMSWGPHPNTEKEWLAWYALPENE